MATLQAFIDQVQDAVGALSGIRGAPDEPPEAINVYPFAVAFAGTGDYEQQKGKMRGNHNVIVELHVARKDLARDVAAAMAYAKSIPNAIYAAQEDGSLAASSYIGRISYTFGPMAWAGVPTLGFRFEIEGVRTEDTIT
jgi:hypothetical protein